MSHRPEAAPQFPRNLEIFQAAATILIEISNFTDYNHQTHHNMAGSKRKRDQNEEPAVVTEVEKPAKESKPEKAEEESSFVELGLDPRLLQAIAEQKFAKPTLVQRKAIPLALNGQDVLAKADCGSGKTAAYVLPVLSSILKRKTVCSHLSVMAHLLMLFIDRL